MDDSGKTGRKDKAAGQGLRQLAGLEPTRGKFFEGVVVSDRMRGSVVVEWPRLAKIEKFHRFSRLSSRIKARNPAAIGAKEGDFVRIEECRKLSKSIGFIVTKIIRKKGEAAS